MFDLSFMIIYIYTLTICNSNIEGTKMLVGLKHVFLFVYFTLSIAKTMKLIQNKNSPK